MFWGSSPALSLANTDESDSGNQQNQKFEIRSLDRIENVTKSIFTSIFQKALIHRCVMNCLKLVEPQINNNANESDKTGLFMQNYSDDQLSNTFQVLKLQREYLYQTFHDLSNIKDYTVHRDKNMQSWMSQLSAAQRKRAGADLRRSTVIKSQNSSKGLLQLEG